MAFETTILDRLVAFHKELDVLKTVKRSRPVIVDGSDLPLLFFTLGPTLLAMPNSETQRNKRSRRFIGTLVIGHVDSSTQMTDGLDVFSLVEPVINGLYAAYTLYPRLETDAAQRRDGLSATLAITDTGEVLTQGPQGTNVLEVVMYYDITANVPTLSITRG